jgi:alkylation response protein AidB-like acyl-CoA dehydrogenase
VPKEYGGAGVSTSVFTEVVALISEADASVGQIPQNHYANVEEIRLIGTEAQKTFFFNCILEGDRLGNAAVERSGKTVTTDQTKLEPDGDGYLLNGEKFYFHRRSLCGLGTGSRDQSGWRPGSCHRSSPKRGTHRD